MSCEDAGDTTAVGGMPPAPAAAACWRACPAAAAERVGGDAVRPAPVTARPADRRSGAGTGRTAAARGRPRQRAGAASALILPLSAPAMPALAAQTMRNAAEMALAEFKAPNIQLLVKDDGGTRAGGAAGGAAGARRRRARSSSARCSPSRSRAVAQVARAAQRAGDRLLDRCQRRGARRLSAELPAGNRCRRASSNTPPRAGQALLRGADPRQRLWHAWSKPRSSQAVGARAAAASWRSSATRPTRHAMQDAGAATVAQAAARGRRDLHSGRRRCGAATWCRRWPPTASIPSACSSSAPGFGTIRASSPTRRCRARWYRGAGYGRLPRLRGRYRGTLRPGSGAHRDARLRCGRAGRRAGQDPGAAALLRPGLTNPSGFTGIDGRVPLPADGTNQRGLAVLRVTQPGAGHGPGTARLAAGRVRRKSRSRKVGSGFRKRSCFSNNSRREIGHHGIEHRKARRRHAQAAVRRDLDRAFLGEHARCASRSSGRPASAA